MVVAREEEHHPSSLPPAQTAKPCNLSPLSLQVPLVSSSPLASLSIYKLGAVFPVGVLLERRIGLPKNIQDQCVLKGQESTTVPNQHLARMFN